jgi:GT2 family glycosyltransferase
MRNCLVLGSGRSGTSMVAGSLARAGYFMGERLYPARDANPLGFFEDPEINGINEALLAPRVPASQGLRDLQRWLAVVDSRVEAPLAPELARRVRALVARAPFCFKDPRFAYTLPAWRPELADARLICVFRDPLVSAASIVKECATADYLRGVEMDVERALSIWCAQYRSILELHDADRGRGRAGDWLFLHYDQMFDGGPAKLSSFLDAPVNADFAKPELARSKPAAATSHGSRRLLEQARRFHSELCELAGFEELAPTADPRPARPRAPIVEPCCAASPAISVLICTYERRATLLECLDAFTKQSLAPDRYEIVVVDDGSKDGSARAVREFAASAAARGAAPIRLLERASNGGLSSARSAAVAAARGELVLLVNDDTIAFPDLLERHLAAHARRAPRPVSVLGTFEQPAEQLRTALMRALERSHLVFGYAGMRSDVDHDWMKFWGCNVSAPRREVLSAGSFDALFRRYGCEDTDLGARLHERGLPVLFEPTARAWHRHVLTFADLERRQRTVARAYVRLFSKQPRLLDHPSWRPFAEQSAAGLEQAMARHRLVRERCLDEARRLAASEGGDVARLLQLLAALNEGWWCEGFLEGMHELGVTSFRELRAWRDEAAQPWPLSTEAPVKLLAWPRWSDDAELAALLEVASDPRLDAPPCLVLRHDRALDGELAEATARLEKASARVLVGERRRVDVSALIVSEPIRERDWPRLGKAATCALLLPSSEDGERARFLDRACVPGVRGVEDLLAFAQPAIALPVETPAPRRASARVWSELSV